MTDIFEILASEEAKEVLGPILDQIEAISKQISEIHQRIGRPTRWVENEEYKRLNAEKEALEEKYQAEKDRLLMRSAEAE